jgi:hemolysin D
MERSNNHKRDGTAAIEAITDMVLPRSNLILLRLITALTFLAIGWFSFSEVDIVSTALGKVVPDGKLKNLQAAEPGIIKNIHVVEGQHVNEGDLLFEFDPTVSESDSASVDLKLRLAKLELDRLESELSGAIPQYENNQEQDSFVDLQEQLRSARIKSHESRTSQLSVEIEDLRHNLKTSELQVESLEKITRHIREQEQKLRPHIGKVVSQFTYDATKEKLLIKENELELETSKIQSLKNEIHIAELRLSSLHNDHQTKLVDEINLKRREVATMRGEAQKLELALSLKELRSPIAGVIQSIEATTIGGVVTEAQTLLKILPNEAPLIIEAQLSNSDIGFVRQGQSVKIKVDAFPFMQFGSLSGVVQQISPDSDNTAHANISASNPQKINNNSSSYYRVRVIADQNQFKEHPHLQIKAGMSVQVDIKIGRRALLQFFVQPLARYWNETVTLR